MGVRESINNNRLVSAIAAIAVIGLAIFMTTRREKSDPGAAASPNGRCWFTIDDGKTWFSDDARKIAPFDHQGAVAYRCYVFTCDGGKTRFVNHLERYLPPAKKMLEDRLSNKGFTTPMGGSFAANVEVKLPGAPESEWTKLTDPRGAAISQPKCPDGTKSNPEPVAP